MKKLIAVLAVLLAIGTTSVFAKGSSKSFAIGAQVGYPLGGALTFKVPSVPCVFALDFAGSSNSFGIGLTADWWAANPTISGTWGYYYGLGLYAGLGVAGDFISVALGPRAVIGTNVFLIDRFLELYLQGGWQPTFYVNTWENGGFGWNFTNFFGNLGFRFWF